MHQIGEMLEDVGLTECIGNAEALSALLHMTMEQALAFVRIRDVFDAEDFVSRALMGTLQ